ncbi:hypothetical protein ACFWU3_27495 [Streptomyces sp. NPDC058685]|uniref:hypothetical protein n=1 Tax=Streptomyces sp. NPDC058685 TaxID=3346598 RepID=UPI0036539D92
MAAGALLSGCGLKSIPESGSAQHSKGLSFEYVGDSGEDETINQMLVISNHTMGAVVPTLSFRAIDKNDHVLPQVEVSTVFGSDRGTLVASEGDGYDILRFTGPGQHDVTDVEVTVQSVETARFLGGSAVVTTQALDSQGRDVERFERFSKVRLTNEDDAPAMVRVAYIVWDQPAEGDTQQATEVTPVGDLVMVPPQGTAVVDVTGAAAAAVARNSRGPAVSIKAYPSQ